MNVFQKQVLLYFLKLLKQYQTCIIMRQVELVVKTGEFLMSAVPKA